MHGPRRRNAVLDALERFRRVEPRVSLTHIVAFLYICENEGLNVAELAQVFGTTRATASRTARALGEAADPDSLPPRLGLVCGAGDPRDQRGKLLRLTDLGRRMRDDLDLVIRQAREIVA